MAFTAMLSELYDAFRRKIGADEPPAKTAAEAVVIEDARFRSIDGKFDALNQTMDQRFDVLNQPIDGLIRVMDQRFDALKQRLDALDRMIDERFATVDQRFAAMVLSRWIKHSRFKANTPERRTRIMSLTRAS